MCVPNLKFAALSVPEIIGGTQKIWADPVYAHAPFSPKFLIGFCSHGPRPQAGAVSRIRRRILIRQKSAEKVPLAEYCYRRKLPLHYYRYCISMLDSGE